MADLDLLFANEISLRSLGWRPVELEGWWDGISYDRTSSRIAGAETAVVGSPEAAERVWPLRLLYIGGDRTDRQAALDLLHKATAGLVEWRLEDGTNRIARGYVSKAPANETDARKRWSNGDLFQTLNIVFPDPVKLSPGYQLLLGEDPVEVPVGSVGARGRVEIYGPGDYIELLALRYGDPDQLIEDPMQLEDLGADEFYRIFLDHTLNIEKWSNASGPPTLLESGADAQARRLGGWWPALNEEDGPQLVVSGAASATFFGQETWK